MNYNYKTEVYFSSCIGTRHENQDNFYIGKKIRKLKKDVSGSETVIIKPGKAFHAVLCDGMGGESNGALSSLTALQAFKKHLKDDDRPAYMNKAVQALQQKFNTLGGCTLVSLELRYDGKGICAYINACGDSPAFLIHDEEIRKITRDDNLFQQLVENDTIPESEEECAEAKATLLEYLGAEAFSVQSYRIMAEHGDTLVLCSDGVNLHEGQIPFWLHLENPAKSLVETSVEENLLKTKSSDNTTALVIKI